MSSNCIKHGPIRITESPRSFLSSQLDLNKWKNLQSLGLNQELKKSLNFLFPSFPTQSLKTLIILPLKSILNPSIRFHLQCQYPSFAPMSLLTYSNNFPTFPHLPLYNHHPHNSLNNLIKSKPDDPFSLLKSPMVSFYTENKTQDPYYGSKDPLSSDFFTVSLLAILTLTLPWYSHLHHLLFSWT